MNTPQDMTKPPRVYSGYMQRATGEGPRGETHICSICRTGYAGFGHNAWPVNDGRCCDICDSSVVVPSRINTLIKWVDEVAPVGFLSFK